MQQVKYCLIIFSFLIVCSFKTAINIPKIQLNIYDDTTYTNWDKFDQNDSFNVISANTGTTYQIVEFETSVTLKKQDGSLLHAVDKPTIYNNLNKTFVKRHYDQAVGDISVFYSVKVMNTKYPGRYLSLRKSVKIKH